MPATTQDRGHHLWRLAPVDAEAAAPLLARAFHDAPLFVHFLPDPEQRVRYCQDLFTFAIRYGCQRGEAWAVGPALGEIAGAAFWIAKPEAAWTPQMKTELGFDTLEARWGALLEASHAPVQRAADAIPELPARWRYLEMIGVEPVRQGQGFGGALLRKVLSDAAAAGVPVGVVTDRLANVAFYLHHGLELVWEGAAPDGTLPFWSFRTPAR